MSDDFKNLMPKITQPWYVEQIMKLEAENAQLKEELARLKIVNEQALQTLEKYVKGEK